MGSLQASVCGIATDVNEFVPCKLAWIINLSLWWDWGLWLCLLRVCVYVVGGIRIYHPREGLSRLKLISREFFYYHAFTGMSVLSITLPNRHQRWINSIAYKCQKHGFPNDASSRNAASPKWLMALLYQINFYSSFPSLSLRCIMFPAHYSKPSYYFRIYRVRYTVPMLPHFRQKKSHTQHHSHIILVEGALRIRCSYS